MVVAVLALAEGGVRAIEPDLPVVRAGDEAEMVIKARQMDAAAATSSAVDVVFLGTSMMDSAIDPKEFQRNSARFGTVYNASIVGAPLATQVRWTRDIVLDRLDPSVVVLGVHPIDVLRKDVFDLNIRPDQADVIFGTVERELRPGLPGDLDRWFHEHAALVRQRGNLRRPSVVASAAWDRVSGTPPEKYLPKRDAAFWAAHLGPQGGSTLFEGVSFRVSDVADRLRENLTPDGFVTADLERLLDVLAAEGAKVVLVVPPVPLDAWVHVGVDRRVLRQGQDLIADIAAARRLPVLDFTDRNYPNELFADVVHLNDRGAVRFSRELALALHEVR